MTLRYWMGAGLAGILLAGTAPAQDKPAAEKPAAPPAAVAQQPQPVKTTATPKLPRRPPPPLVARWGQIDADHDGKANFGEIKQVLTDFKQERFNQLDRNHDGQITTDELPPTPGAPVGDPSKSPVQAAAQPGFALMRVLELADKDKDMKVTPEEYKAAYPNQPEDRFKALDKNNDGVISNADLPLKPDTGGGFMRADANGDGKVSRDEFMTAFPKSPPDRFSKLDKNGDGFWDESDTKAAAPPKDGPAEHPMPQDWTPVIKSLLTQYDKDKDGKITWDEYSAGKPGLAHDGFDKLDTNHDGVINTDDKAPAIDMKALTASTPGDNAERMKKADKNGDGKLSFEEASAEFKGMTQERFKERDLNGDGFLGPEDRALRKAGITAPVKRSGASPAGGKEAPQAKPAEKPAAEAPKAAPATPDPAPAAPKK